jgi:hypothetical protein
MKLIISVIAAFFVAQPALAQSNTSPQQRQRISFRAPNSNTKYVQQHVIDAGDVPGHQLRVFEVQVTFGQPAVATGQEARGAVNAAARSGGEASGAATTATDVPVFNGVRATQTMTRGVSDYTDSNGRVFGYSVISLENGDRIFARYEGLVLTPTSGQTNANYVLTLTGGTGAFRNIRGTIRGKSSGSFSGGKATSIDAQYEGEYWLESSATGVSNR